MGVKWTQLVVDADDPAALADFWCQVFGWEVIDVDEEEGDVEIGAPGGDGPTLLFEVTPDERVVKNRLHIDVRATPGSDQAAELERLLALGATEIDIGQGEQSWVVLADPEGNEFCLLRNPTT